LGASCESTLNKPTDNAFCACAEQGHAAFIATLNRKDFPQKNLVAKVISPGDHPHNATTSFLIGLLSTAAGWTGFPEIRFSC
jgi:hypothetical protein